MKITANWEAADAEEAAKNAIFLKAGEACLGYVDVGDDGKYMACFGSGMGAPLVYFGPSLDSAKAAVEAKYK